ncbi:hypothetical protein E1297_01145, partial [Roseibium sp. RKSG952]|nr:hypothetical protein [Roseibium sp. RKSG952]
MVRVDRCGVLPLSFQQERLWFLDRLDAQAGAAYHIEGAFRLEGPLDAEALDQALTGLVARHEGLRTVFVNDGGGTPCQKIRPAQDSGFRLERADATGLDEAALRERIEAVLAQRFDLEAGPLFRAALLQLSAVSHVLVIGGHHAVLDGWSLGVLVKELAALYGEACGGGAADLPELDVQYPDYAVWQRKVLSGERLAQETAWWRETLEGLPEAITLPFDRPRPEVIDHAGGLVPVAVGREA